jgi:hypothetical protein
MWFFTTVTNTGYLAIASNGRSKINKSVTNLNVLTSDVILEV